MGAQGGAAAEEDLDDSPAGRIVAAAREQFLALGYRAFTVDALARTLGMSKKTIYKHFPSKDVVIAASIDAAGRSIRRETQAILGDEKLSFTRKLSGVMAVIGAQYSRMRPALLRELQHKAPALHEKIDGIRRNMTPLVIGRLLRMGIAEGMVRPDLDIAFAVEMWIAAATGLLDPGTLERLGVAPREAVERGIRLFFRGVLTEKGRADLARQRAPAG